MAKIRTKRLRGKEAAAPGAEAAGVEACPLGRGSGPGKRRPCGRSCFYGGDGRLMALLEEDREALCGPRHEQSEGRENHRYGYDTGPLVLGGRKVAVRKPRVRSIGGDEEIELPTWRQFSRRGSARRNGRSNRCWWG